MVIIISVYINTWIIIKRVLPEYILVLQEIKLKSCGAGERKAIIAIFMEMDFCTGKKG